MACVSRDNGWFGRCRHVDRLNQERWVGIGVEETWFSLKSDGRRADQNVGSESVSLEPYAKDGINWP